MIDRILTNGTVTYKIPEAVPDDDDYDNNYRNPGTELSDTIRSIGHFINFIEGGGTIVDWHSLDYCLGWIYFRTCSIELSEETVALYMSDEEWDIVNKGIALNSRHQIGE
jgi:hypothetical protein